MRTLQHATLAFAVVTSFAAFARPAHADLGACDDIFVEASATCEVVAPSVQCEAMCTPITVRATCSAQLAAECEGTCDELPSVSCQGSCEADCSADCEVDPGKFDCQGSCEADCSGNCSARCDADEDSASCEARCEGKCSSSCTGHCEAEPPTADCDASCKASCDGSCQVDADLDCELRCSADARADCEADLQGGCEAQCKREEGALFCDGQFVDHGDNLDECIAALKAKYHVEVEAHGESSCDDGSCQASGSVSAKADNCSVLAPGAAAGGNETALALLALAGLTLRVRRDRRARR